MVRRSLNYRVLIVSVVAAAALAGVVFLLHRWQVGRTATGLLALAAAQEKESQWLKAADYLDRYLRLRPDDGPTRVRLALTFGKLVQEQPKYNTRAVELYYKALAAGIEDQTLQLRRELANCLLGVSNFNAAEQEADKILEKLSQDPAASRVKALAVTSQFLTGSQIRQNNSKLLGVIEEARILNPGDAALAEREALLLREFPDVVLAEHADWTEPMRRSKADKCLDDLVQANPKSFKGCLARYRYRTQYRMAEAASDLDAAIRLAPNELEVALTAAEHDLRQAQEVRQANGESAVVQELATAALGRYERIIQQSDEKKEPVPAALLGRGRALLLAGDVEKALAAWHSGLVVLSQYSEVPLTVLLQFHIHIADTCIEQQRFGEADAALKDTSLLLNKLTGVPKEQLVLAKREQELRRLKLHLQKREFAAALNQSAKVVSSQAGGPAHSKLTFEALVARASALSALGEWPQVAATYEEAARLQPALQPVRLEASGTWLLAGRPEEACVQAEAALHVAETPAAWMALAVAQLQLQSKLPPAQQNWKRLGEALAALEKSRDAASTSATAPWRLDFLMAEVALAKAKSTGNATAGNREAAEILRAAEGRHALRPAFWMQVTLAYQALKLPADADRALAEFRKSGGKSVEAALLTARLSSLRQDFVEAKSILTAAVAQASTAEQPLLRAELLRVALVSKDFDAARKMLQAELKGNPRNVAPLRLLAEIDLERKDFEAVKQWEQALRGAGEAGAQLADYYGAWRTSIATNAPEELKQSLATLQRLVESKPRWAEAVALKGLLEQRLNRLTEALNDFILAEQLGERRTFIIEQLIALLDHFKRPADVDRYLARLESEIPLSQRLTEMASLQELNRDEPGRALEIARKRATEKPTDAAPQLWLARLLMKNGQKEEAGASFRKALELDPANAQTWNSLLSFYAATDQQEAIRALLPQLTANQALAENQRELVLGQAHEYLGDREAAQSSYVRAAAKAEKDLAAQLRVAQFFMQSNPEQAKVHLEAALKIDPTSLAAKRMLAIADAAMGDLSTASALLSAEGSAASEDVRLNVLLLMQQGGQLNLRRAVTLLEGIAARDSAVQPTDRLLLARLYEQQSQIAETSAAAQECRSQADKQLAALATASQPDATHLATYIQFLVRHGQQAAAEKWVATLEKEVNDRPKKDADRVALVVQMQILTGLAKNSSRWLSTLADLEPDALRLAALQARVAQLSNPDVNGESFVEPKAAKLLAAATSAIEKQRLYAAVGEVYSGLKNYSAAERWYRLLNAEAPQSFPAVAGALARQGRLSDAVDFCQQVAKTDQTAMPAYILATMLVQYSAKPNDIQRAEPILNAALGKFEKDVNLLNAVALVRVAQGDDAQAVGLYRQIVKANPRSVAALNNLAMILAERPADRAEALQLIDDAIAIAGRDAGLLDTKGAILVYSGRSGEAVPLLESATREAQADPRHHFHLALAYRDQGKTAEAKSQLQTALDRKLVGQLLTPTDQKLLGDLRSALQL